MTTEEKAQILLNRLTNICMNAMKAVTVETIMEKATPEEIDWYFDIICKGENNGRI